ncbi:MAG: hypothetical protein J7L79_05430 [Thaumarchaeota archaeon]|nr:hypothetical protein [Nitrososphaerota archaeon]
MPKRVVIKDSDLEEAEPVIEPVEEAEERVEEIEEAPASKPSREEAELEEATADADAAYELVMSKAEEIRVREQVTQKKFLEDEGMSLGILKKLLQRWDALRDELIGYVNDAIEKHRKLRDVLEQKFSAIEEELYFNQVELDTLMQLEAQGRPISVSKKEELERVVPKLREELVGLDKRIKEVDARIDQLRGMSENIYESTSYKDMMETIFSQLLERLQSRYESPEEARIKIRSQIELIAQREGIPKEYAAIYLWKRLRGTG